MNKINKDLHKMILIQGDEYSPYEYEVDMYIDFVEIIKDFDTFKRLAKYLIKMDSSSFYIDFRHFFNNYNDYKYAVKLGYKIDEISMSDYGWIDTNLCVDDFEKHCFGKLNHLNIEKSKKGNFYIFSIFYDTINRGGCVRSNSNVFDSEINCFVAGAEEYLQLVAGDKIEPKIRKFLLDIYFKKTGKTTFPFEVKVGSQLSLF